MSRGWANWNGVKVEYPSPVSPLILREPSEREWESKRARLRAWLATPPLTEGQRERELDRLADNRGTWLRDVLDSVEGE